MRAHLARSVLVSALVAGCAEGPLDDDSRVVDGGADDPSSFIALARDFQGFLSWERVFAGVGTLSSVDGHGDAERYVHLNRRPDDDDDAFPIGTLLVKTHETAAPRTEWEIFAMAKRSTTYNEDGATGWEWFELGLDENDAAVIVWRGTKPPEGHNYGCLTGACVERGSCNVCHVAPENDHVLTPELDYSAQFAASALDDDVE